MCIVDNDREGKRITPLSKMEEANWSGFALIVTHQLDSVPESRSQRVMPISAASTSAGNVLEMKILRCLPRPTWVEFQQSEL